RSDPVDRRVSRPLDPDNADNTQAAALHAPRRSDRRPATDDDHACHARGPICGRAVSDSRSEVSWKKEPLAAWLPRLPLQANEPVHRHDLAAERRRLAGVHSRQAIRRNWGAPYPRPYPHVDQLPNKMRETGANGKDALNKYRFFS